VLERPFEDVREDLHVGVAVRAEALPRLDAVFVDDAQRAEAHVLRVVEVGERERVEALEPAVGGVSAVVCASEGEHGERRTTALDEVPDRRGR
jgi:hypothetical protein